MVAALRDEIARLKGGPGRPNIKPSGMEQATEPKPPGGSGNQRRGRGSTRSRLSIHEERTSKSPHHRAAPASRANELRGAGSGAPRACGGFPPRALADAGRQDDHGAVAGRHSWPFRAGVAPLRAAAIPPGPGDGAAAGALLRALGIGISKRQVMRLLIDGQDGFLARRVRCCVPGLDSRLDHGGRHRRAPPGRQRRLHADRQSHFAWFGTTGSKSRLNFLELLRAGYTDYVINDAALAYMREHALAAPSDRPPGRASQSGICRSDGLAAHLEQLGITRSPVTPDPVRIATEGALWGSVKAHGFLPETVIVSDDAGQFNVGQHALCWVHAERLVHKLDTFTDLHRAAQQRPRADLVVLRRPEGLSRRSHCPAPGRVARSLRPHFPAHAPASSPSIGCSSGCTPTSPSC